MNTFIDMTGWVMAEHGVADSRLTVIKRGENTKNGSARWWCQCNCGNPELKLIVGTKLRSGETQSCGCLQREITKEKHKRSNIYDISGEYGILWSNNTNQEIYFDLEDAKEILQYTWYVSISGYPTTTIESKNVAMHMFLGLARYDHIDRNKLNNRRNNLRPCTERENARNKTIPKTNTSGIIGVSWDKQTKKWIARIGIDYKDKKLGRFQNKEDAIRARLQAEAKYFGEFAPQRHLFDEYGVILNG